MTKKKKNICDECGFELEKTYIISEFGLPLTVWVCPQSEIYNAYESEFMKKYHKKRHRKDGNE